MLAYGSGTSQARNGRPETSIAVWARHSSIGTKGPPVALDAGTVPERLGQREAERDPDVLDGVVASGLEVTARGDLEIDQRVVRQQGQHVVEEADAGRDVRLAGSVEVHAHAHVGLAGDAL